MTIYTTTLPSPLGTMHAYATDAGLCALIWRDSERVPAALDAAVTRPEHPTLARLAHQLAEYFAGTRRDFDLPLDPVGTEFQRAAWRALATIPYGTTRTYGQQAAAIGRPKAVRAIGAANGRNPIPIVVPCHRVIGADGSLTGFGGGLDKKRFLLAHEAAHAPTCDAAGASG